MYCPNCGNEIADGSRFCPKCGAKLQKTDDPWSRQDSGSWWSQGAQADNDSQDSQQNSGGWQQNSQQANRGWQTNQQGSWQQNSAGWQQNSQPYGGQPVWGGSWSTYPDVKRRNIALCIIFSIITCGIYGIYWYICLANDINTVSGHPDDTSGGMVFLFSLITLGIYSWYWIYKAGEKLDETAYNHRRPTNSRSVLYLVLAIIGLSIVAWALMQSDINEYAGYE